VKPFLLNGQPINTEAIPASVLKIKAFLSKLPDNELLDRVELTKKAGMSAHSGYTCTALAHPLLADFCQTIRYPARQNVWGNKKTIAALRKHKEILA
jgi:hypothetical protein